MRLPPRQQFSTVQFGCRKKSLLVAVNSEVGNTIRLRNSRRVRFAMPVGRTNCQLVGIGFRGLRPRTLNQVQLCPQFLTRQTFGATSAVSQYRNTTLPTGARYFSIVLSFYAAFNRTIGRRQRPLTSALGYEGERQSPANIGGSDLCRGCALGCQQFGQDGEESADRHPAHQHSYNTFDWAQQAPVVR